MMRWMMYRWWCEGGGDRAWWVVGSVFIRSPDKGFWACLGDIPPDMPRRPETWVYPVQFNAETLWHFCSAALLLWPEVPIMRTNKSILCQSCNVIKWKCSHYTVIMCTLKQCALHFHLDLCNKYILIYCLTCLTNSNKFKLFLCDA